MDDELRRMLDELLARGREHDEGEAVHARRLLNLEADTAQLMAILVQSGRRARVLEIGTSNGYSAVWLAWALRPLGGHLETIERDGDKQAEAEANLRRVGLRDGVTLHLGDASAVVAALPGPFDCVFFDADRRSAPEQLRLLLPKLVPDALLLCDNVLSHPDEVAGYLAAIAALPDFQHVIVPVGKGLSVAYRRGEKETVEPPRRQGRQEERETGGRRDERETTGGGGHIRLPLPAWHIAPKPPVPAGGLCGRGTRLRVVPSSQAFSPPARSHAPHPLTPPPAAPGPRSRR